MVFKRRLKKAFEMLLPFEQLFLSLVEMLLLRAVKERLAIHHPLTGVTVLLLRMPLVTLFTPSRESGYLE